MLSIKECVLTNKTDGRKYNELLIKSYLKRGYCTESILSILLRSFLNSKMILEEDIPRYSFLKEVLEVENKCDNSFSISDIWDFGMLLEVLLDIDKGKKRRKGAFYTPLFIVDYLVSSCIDIFLEREYSEVPPSFLDPSCGCGIFLLRTLEIYKNIFSTSYSSAINYVMGVDIDSRAIRFSRLMLELFILLNREDPPAEFNNVLHKQDFLDFPLDLKFDIISTNPPYVKLQNLPTKYRRLREKFDFLKGNYTLANLFLVKSYLHLEENGVLGFIFPNNIFTSLSAKKLREYLKNVKAIRRIIDFKHSKIFDKAQTYTALIFLTKQKSDFIEYTFTLKPKLDLNSRHLKFHIIDSEKYLGSDRWILASAEDLENIFRIESIGTPLGKLVRIKVGFATLKDDIFLLSREEIRKYSIEQEILKPAVKVAEVREESEIRDKQKFIIFPYKKRQKKWEVITPEEFSKLFPNAFDYLLKHRTELERRSSFRKGQIKYFYEWGRTQGRDSFSPKLLTKTFNKRAHFLLDTSDALFCNGYAIVFEREVSLEDYRVLQKILNSIVMNYYIKLTSYTIEGNYSCFQKNFIERFGIPNLGEKEKKCILELEGEELDLYLAELYGIDLKHILETLSLLEFFNG